MGTFSGAVELGLELVGAFCFDAVELGLGVVLVALVALYPRARG